MSARTETLAPRAPAWLAPAAIAIGCAALWLRSISYESVATTALVGAAGVLGPAGRAGRLRPTRWLLATAVGMAAFALGHSLGPAVGVRLTGLGIFSIVLAAVAEEAFFRRFVYARLERFGAVAAVAGSALLFAVVHVPMYGAAVLPVDLAAGLVLGWQRRASGGWSSPALTHVLANLLQMG
jgi:membrane protease YdiL (CAAX protease family)